MLDVEPEPEEKRPSTDPWNLLFCTLRPYQKLYGLCHLLQKEFFFTCGFSANDDQDYRILSGIISESFNQPDEAIESLEKSLVEWAKMEEIIKKRFSKSRIAKSYFDAILHLEASVSAEEYTEVLDPIDKFFLERKDFESCVNHYIKSRGMSKTMAEKLVRETTNPQKEQHQYFIEVKN